jgi:pyruvate dehydrogenase E1 component beta subunit
VVQESSESAGVGDTILARVTGECFSAMKCAPRLIAGPDTPVPFARELESHYIPSSGMIGRTLDEMMRA